MWRRRHLHEGRIAGHWLAVEGLPKPILWALVPMAFSGWVATLAGWYTTEIGRQPWLVQGVMTTEMAVAEVPAPMVMGTLVTYLAIYAALLFAYIGVIVYLARKAARGDDAPANDMMHSGKAQVAPSAPRSDAHAARFHQPRRLAALGLRLAHGLSILIYVILDGFDLGVGILFPLATPEEQDRMIGSIGPFWDANETWLVLAVGLLLVAFPVAHGMILSTLYLPVFVMLIGLILRGVAFEFRAKARDHHKRLWNRLFFTGSLMTALAQGFMLGLYIMGLEARPATYAFAALTAVFLVVGYSFHRRDMADPQDRGRAAGNRCGGRSGASGASSSASARCRWPRPSSARASSRNGSPSPRFSTSRPCRSSRGPWSSGSGDAAADALCRRPPLVAALRVATALFALAYLGMAYSFYPYVVPER
jgi:cytochrome d ubiquinol oxidase subunit II